ncbi:hypothetical protein C7999DRAFT_36970 [Corynascus novoguineensis]|uniref:Uncharacterized protein n=1 Tax=Corynascus novoguineensis TaxID=1126955 RepID=A0AAN7D2G3_9PEZI|nr:hypothetical protein C7999DRAFT_36970 [Corynascus novoguineensis]
MSALMSRCPSADNTFHKLKPDDALRSEITTGIFFTRKRIQLTHKTHSTIAVLVFSFYHNEMVCITQMCWNGENSSIIIRQSRLVDISSTSLRTEEIFLILRWIYCTPLREPRVSRRQASTRAHSSTTPKPRAPAMALQKGTNSTLDAHGDTNAETPGITSGGNSPPRLATPTSTRGAPGSNTSGSPPRPASKTGSSSTLNTISAVTTPSSNAAENTTTPAISGGNGAAQFPGHNTNSMSNSSPARASNAPTPKKTVNLPTRSARGNGGTSSNVNKPHARQLDEYSSLMPRCKVGKQCGH